MSGYGYQLLKGVGGGGGGGRSMRLWLCTLLAVLVILSFSFHWHLTPGTPKLEPLVKNDDEHYARCKAAGGYGVWTRHRGGAPGYEVFENVWYRDGIFLMFTPDKQALPAEEDILSPRTTVIVETETPDEVVPSACFSGTTLFFNEGAGGGWVGLGGKYGFIVESVLGAYAALSNALPGEAIKTDNAIMPWDSGWRNHQHNGRLATGLWGKNVVEPSQWSRLEKLGEQGIYFERIVIVDRWAAHRKKESEVNTWNKMCTTVFAMPHFEHFWANARKAVQSYFEVPGPSRIIPRRHHIVYLDRQDTKRRMSVRDHNAVVHTMGALAKKKGIAFDQLLLSNMTEAELIMATSTATVMIGVHGSGLINMLWMPEKATVIELFPLEFFNRDYELPASVLGFNYTGIRGDEIIDKAKWEADPGIKNGHKKDDGTAVSISVPLLVQTVREALDRPL